MSETINEYPRAARARNAAADAAMGADGQRARICRGAAALLQAFEIMGREGTTDHEFCKPIVDGELDVRALVNFALAAINEAD